jgi:hypothetical protein
MRLRMLVLFRLLMVLASACIQKVPDQNENAGIPET